MLTRTNAAVPLALGALLTLCPRAALAQSAGGAPAPQASPGPISEQSEFEKGKNAYRAQKYEEAETRFLQMLDPRTGTLHDKILIRQARMYLAATLLAEHHDEEAAELFGTILTEDKDYEPDALAFPVEVLNAFSDTRARLREKLDAIERENFKRLTERRAREEALRLQREARVKQLERLAGEAEVTEKNSRWVALVPFGFGQFRNGQRGLGWFFLGTEAALIVGSLVAVPVYYVNLANAHDNQGVFTNSIAQQYLDRANTALEVNEALNGVFAATAVIGAIQAEVAFVPQTVKIKQRPVPDLPPAVTAPSNPVVLSFGATPLAGPDGHGLRGASVGLSGRF